jgi:hypothetical protein
MCLIVHREVKGGRGSNIPNHVIEYNRKKNPDGFGIAWRQGGKLQHQKFAPNDHGAFEKLLKTIDKQSHIEYVAHWRFATTGEPCEDLSHPFPYEDAKDGEVLVFHNGVIDIETADKKESDTLAFVRNVLAKLEPQWWKKSHLRFLVEGSTGWSRLLLMTKKQTIRLNAGGWNLDGGIWYSQKQFAPFVPATKPMSLSLAKDGEFASPATKLLTADSGLDDDNKDDSDAYLAWQESRNRNKRLVDSIDEDPDDFDDFDDEGIQWSGWMDEGHWVYPVTGLDIGGGGEAICAECNTQGEYYVEGGKSYANISHIIKLREPAASGYRAN